MIRSNSQGQLKIALVHDYLNEYGGAERVLGVLCEIFPKAPIYTAFAKGDSPAYRRFRGRKIITSWAQNIPFFANGLYSPLRFLAPWIWGSFSRQLADYDVVISSASWFVSKGFGKRSGLSSSLNNEKGQTLAKQPVEICYCHTPPRYLYGYVTASDIKRNFLTRLYALIVNHFMRVYDWEAAQRVDYFIANSKEVASRIKKFYRRDSVVIYPPVNVNGSSLMVHWENTKKAMNNERSTMNENCFLVVSRLVASKNVDVVVEVCAKLGLPLKVVGTGRELDKLKTLVSRLTMNNQQSTIDFVGDVSDDELIKLYQNCRAVIFAASEEHFGIAPVEAMAAGKPVIVSAEGGVLESVVDWPKGKGKCTGVYFDPPTAGSLTLAINNFISLEKKGYFDPKFIRRHAQKFSKERFRKQIVQFVKSIVR